MPTDDQLLHEQPVNQDQTTPAGQEQSPDAPPAGEQLNPYHQKEQEFDPNNPGGAAADRQW